MLDVSSDTLLNLVINSEPAFSGHCSVVTRGLLKLTMRIYKGRIIFDLI